MVRSGEYYHNVVWPETRSATENLFHTIRNNYLKFEDATYFDTVAFVYAVLELRNSTPSFYLQNKTTDDVIFDYVIEKFNSCGLDYTTRINGNIKKLCSPRHNDFPSILRCVFNTGKLSFILEYIRFFFESEVSKFGKHVDIEGFAEIFYSQMGVNIPQFCLTWGIDKEEDGNYFIFQKVYSDFCTLEAFDDEIINKKHIDAEYVWDHYDGEGFVRVLTSDRRWGYISKENGNLYLLDSDAIYTHSFQEGFALVQKYNSVYYIDARIKKVFEKEFSSGSQFKNGVATVSDKICEEFRIDTNGNIIEEDKMKYYEALEERKKHPVLGHFSTSGFVSAYDTELELLDDGNDDETVFSNV